MKKYLGVKEVEAEPMTEREAKEAGLLQECLYKVGDKDWTRDGYKVVYENGYVSWSPKDTFEEAYRPVNNMTFGLAIEALKKGYKVARKGWNGKNLFIFLVPGSTFKVNRPPLLGIYPEGTEIDYHSHIDMKTSKGEIVPWFASQSDMLSEDWVIVE